MTPAMMKNIGAFLATIVCGAARAVAAGAGDNTKLTGQSIDRRSYGFFNSGVVAVAVHAVLTAADDCTIAIEIQESADGSAWDTAVELRAAATVFTAAQIAAGGAQYGRAQVDVDFSARKRFCRFNVTPNLSAGATDVMEQGTILVVYASDVLPIT